MIECFRKRIIRDCILGGAMAKKRTGMIGVAVNDTSVLVMTAPLAINFRNDLRSMWLILMEFLAIMNPLIY
jgi:hypothetical protein